MLYCMCWFRMSHFSVKPCTTCRAASLTGCTSFGDMICRVVLGQSQWGCSRCLVAGCSHSSCGAFYFLTFPIFFPPFLTTCAKNSSSFHQSLPFPCVRLACKTNEAARSLPLQLSRRMAKKLDAMAERVWQMS